MTYPKFRALGIDVLRVELDENTFGWYSEGLYFTDMRCWPQAEDSQKKDAAVAA